MVVRAIKGFALWPRSPRQYSLVPILITAMPTSTQFVESFHGGILGRVQCSLSLLTKIGFSYMEVKVCGVQSNAHVKKLISSIKFICRLPRLPLWRVESLRVTCILLCSEVGLDGFGEVKL